MAKVKKNEPANDGALLFRKRAFPKQSLQEALRIADALKTKNSGNKWPPSEVAKSLEVSQKAMPFFYLAAASRDYGLTTGSRDSEFIELAQLGRDIVYAADPASERAKKIEAFTKVELFKSVLDYYRGSNLPEMKYLSNTLVNKFKVPSEEHEEFSKIFRENCTYLSIGDGIATTGEQSASTTSTNRTAVPATVTVAESKSKLVAFVIMPFLERDAGHPKGFFTEVLRSLITPAAQAAGFTVKTANRQGSDVIQSTIVNELIQSDLVICDLTEHNPNVLFELGVRMVKEKPIALIKANGTGRIFDIDNMIRVEEYSPNLWRTTIEKDIASLKEHFEAAYQNFNEKNSYMQILLRPQLAMVQSPVIATPAATTLK